MKTRTSQQSAMEDQKEVALLIIDVQRGLFAKSTPIYQADALLKNISALVDRAHRAGAPVFYVQHSDKRFLVKGSDEWQLHPALHPLNSDCIVHKQHGSAFEDTGLGQELKARGVKSVVVTGLVTHGCVRATCLDAKRSGYTVILAQDGHSNFSQQAAQLIEKWNQKLSEKMVELKATREIKFKAQ
jgi:nicotinamidase-related amidase